MKPHEDGNYTLEEQHPEETVTVPRWALEHVLEFGAPSRRMLNIGQWASALHSLRRALDTKAEIPDENAQLRAEVDRLRKLVGKYKVLI